MAKTNDNNVITGTCAKRADRYAIDILGIPSLTLMETASRAVADHITDNYPSSSVTVLSGTGNNGADGICIARILQQSNLFKGEVKVFITGNIEHATWEFLYQLSELRKSGLSFKLTGDADALPASDILIDAVFGIGLKTQLKEDKAMLLRKVDAKAFRHVVAVDVPSGINSDTGELMGAGIHADTTITFGRNKTGLVTKDGPEYSGSITVKDIGIPDEAYLLS